MENFFTYFLKVTLASALFFGYYRLALREKTFHQYNRFYLLFSVVASFLLPLLKVEFFTIKISPKILDYSKIIFAKNSAIPKDSFDYNLLIIYFLATISLFFLVKFGIGIFKIFRLKKSSRRETFNQIKIYHTETEEAPFSFLKSLFWKDSIALNSDSGRQILRHEMVHIEQKHSWDRIFLQIICSIFWFNPIFHLIKKEIVLIHEYLADNNTIKNADTKAFAQMLLATSLYSGREFATASPFFSSNLKKRLKMLQKPKTKNGYSGRILALPVAIAVAFTLMVKAKNQEIAKVNSLVNSAKNDTIPRKKGEIMVMRDKSGFDFDKKLAESTEKSLFIINGDQKSREEFLNFYNKNKDSKNWISSYTSAENNKELTEEFGVLGPYGEYEKYGVFQLDEVAKLKENTKKYWALQDKYSPEWRQYLKSLEKPENQKRLEKVKEKQSQKIHDTDPEGIQVKTVAEESAKVFDDAEESAKEAKKVAYEASRTAVLEGIKAKEAEKRAKEIDTEEARQLAKKAYEKAQEAKKLSTIAHEKAGYETISVGRENVIIKNKNDKGKLSYFIDNKQITEEEMKKIPADKIESVNVVGKPNDDASIYITSKK